MTIPSSQFNGSYEPLGKVVTFDPAFASITITPAPQLTTSAFVAVVGSTIDTAGGQTNVAYQVTAASHDIKAKIQGSFDGVNWTDLITAAVVTSGSTAVLNAASTGAVTAYAGYRYYQLVIEDNVGGTHGTATVIGFAK